MTKTIQFTLSHLAKTNPHIIMDWLENSHEQEQEIWKSLLKFLKTWENLLLPDIEEGDQYALSYIEISIEVSKLEYKNILHHLNPFARWVKIETIY